MSRRALRAHADNPAVLAVILGIYFGLGKLALWIGADDGLAPVVWAPGGFALVAMLVLGRSIWPVVFTGAFLAYIDATGEVAVSMAHGVGNAAETVVAAALIDRAAGGLGAFRRADTLFRLLAIVALVATPLSAALAAGAGTLNGVSVWTDLALVWMTSWLSHLTGILVLAPFLALWIAGPTESMRWYEVVEAIVVIALVGVVSAAVFGDLLPVAERNYPLEFMCMPFLLWAAVRFGRRQMATAVLVLAANAVWGTIHGYGPFAGDTPHEALVLVQAYTCVTAITGLVLASAIVEHRDAEAQLRQLAITDPLTGLANYRRLIEVMRTEIARSRRTSRPFAVVFLDMDGLKRINDRHGHLAGSRALTRLADLLRTSTRSLDTPARYGGDEFAIVLPETGEEGGRVVLARIADRLAADPAKPTLSISGGVAAFPRDGDSPTLLLRAADKLLYEAKARSTAARKAAGAPPADQRTGTLF
jgi:diguanylate cyclase (GGDEF)-like protein